MGHQIGNIASLLKKRRVRPSRKVAGKILHAMILFGPLLTSLNAYSGPVYIYFVQHVHVHAKSKSGREVSDTLEVGNTGIFGISCATAGTGGAHAKNVRSIVYFGKTNSGITRPGFPNSRTWSEPKRCVDLGPTGSAGVIEFTVLIYFKSFKEILKVLQTLASLSRLLAFSCKN